LLITFSLNIKQQFQKNKQFYSYPPPLCFSVLSLLFASSQSFRHRSTLLSLQFSILLLFPMLLRSLFRNLSLFPPLLPFFVPLFFPVKYLPSIFFDPFHQSLLLCIFHLAFGFSFPIPPSSSQFLAPLSPMLPLKSPPKSINLPYFLLLRLQHVFLFSSSLYCTFSLFSTIYCLYELFFPFIFFLLSFLVPFL
jgi:hypothetical protein